MRFGKMTTFVYGILLMLLAMLWLPNIESSIVEQVPFKNPAYPGMCFVSNDLILSRGRSSNYPKMECARIICGQNSMAQIHTCGIISFVGHRALGRKYPDAYYPDCCERNYIAVKSN